MRILAVLGLAACLAGCGTPVRQNTASGRPEVTVHQVPADRVKAAIVNEMIDMGYRITKDSQFEIAFDRPTDNPVAAVLFGSKYDAQPNARISYSIAQMGNDVRVVADMAIITNPGSGFEQRTDVSDGADSPKIQEFLDGMARSLAPQPPESKKRTSSNTPVPASGGYVVQVNSQKTEAEAQAAWRQMQSRFPTVLRSRVATIRRVDLGAHGVFYRAMLGPFADRDQASEFCQTLTTAGGDCIVQRN
jgi:SPOR domain